MVKHYFFWNPLIFCAVSILACKEAVTEAVHLSLPSHCLKLEGVRVSVSPISDSLTSSITYCLRASGIISADPFNQLFYSAKVQNTSVFSNGKKHIVLRASRTNEKKKKENPTME